MRVLKRNPWLTGLGTVLSLLGLWWGSAQADATTDQTASVLIFPKVIADGTRDTLIQITNTMPFEVKAHCEYTNGTGRCSVSDAICTLNSDCPAGETCAPQEFTCQSGDFEINLTRNQPTIWRVSTGRQLNLGQPTLPGECNPPGDVCPGFDAGGQVPPPPGGTDGFRGELRCFEVDESDFPIGNNAIKGEAIIQTLGGLQISEYNAIGLRFRDSPGANDYALQLDNFEYDACPLSLVLNHYSEGADDLVACASNSDGSPRFPDSCAAAGDAPVVTQLTVIPCTVDYELETHAPATLQFSITNEFEQTISASTALSCWYNGLLSQISPTQFSVTTLGSTLAKTRVRPGYGRCVGGTVVGACASDADCGGGQCRPETGILAVSESFYANVTTTTLGTAAVNLHFNGARGVCRNSGIDCSLNGDADCDPADAGDLCATDTIVRSTP